jgi:hypothetical protein
MARNDRVQRGRNNGIAVSVMTILLLLIIVVPFHFRCRVNCSTPTILSPGKILTTFTSAASGGSETFLGGANLPLLQDSPPSMKELLLG